MQIMKPDTGVIFDGSREAIIASMMSNARGCAVNEGGGVRMNAVVSGNKAMVHKSTINRSKTNVQIYFKSYVWLCIILGKIA